MTPAQYIQDLRVMITADIDHLRNALDTGHRVHAHQFVDAIIDNTRILEDTLRQHPETASIAQQ